MAVSRKPAAQKKSRKQRLAWASLFSAARLRYSKAFRRLRVMIGEHPKIATAPAITNVISDAPGTRFTDMPLTAAKIY